MALKGRSEEILIVTTVFLTISTTVFAMRCFVRFRLLKTCRADDIFMICATLMNDALATCTITGAVNGMGSKFAQLDAQEIQTALMITIWSNVEANLGVMAGNLITLRPLFRWFHDVSSRGSSGRDSSGKFLVASRDMPNHLQTRNSITGSTQWSPEAGSQEPHNFLSSAAPRGQVNPVSALGGMYTTGGRAIDEFNDAQEMTTVTSV
ncbi:hypothetical protein ETB97_000840 [Aspergillus alliaceus]|uniref:Uncharacterized protein n=1 Tax=Petromyces alliaceus TaxID=209559 RepID=A0A8H6A585_PETAA|nr:hypothetical protein ETB97_000840 [Aspergillus burnettii]